MDGRHPVVEASVALGGQARTTKWCTRGISAVLFLLLAVGLGQAQVEEPIPPLGGPVAQPLRSIETVPGSPEVPTIGHLVEDVPAVAMEQCVDCEQGWLSGLYLFGEYLLVRPRRDAHDFAVLSPNPAEAPGGTIESLAWETVNGYRVGGGFELPGEEPWLVGVTYSYFHSRDDRRLVNPPGGGFLFATSTRGGGIDDVTLARGSSNIDYDVLDVEAIRVIPFSSHTNLRLFGGGRFAWIDQKFLAIYNGGSVGANFTNVSSPVEFRGAGLTFGSEVGWKIYRGLGLYARGRGSLLSGEFTRSLTERDGSFPVAIVNVHETVNQIVPVLDLGVGLAWEGEHVFFRVGYEMSNWFNMVNSPDFPGAANLGKVGRRTSDLTLEALSVQLGFIF
jgi:hypothetical protein